MEKYKTSKVCSTEIHFEIEDDFVKDVIFKRGCAGNALGISSLVKGLKVEEVIARLKGIDCGGRGTSCPDQLTKALEAYINQ